MLHPSSLPLCRVYDLAILDLDGVVYRGSRAVTGAAKHLAAARGQGLRLAFATNNASRPPEAVAEHLCRLDVPAYPQDVVTSAQAAARLLYDVARPGARVLLLGGPGLDVALREEGFVPVTRLKDHPEAVVSGYGPDLPWWQIVQAAMSIRAGLPWVASNADLTIPTSGGVGPGHGFLVRMLQEFSGVVPAIAGKPARSLIDEAVSRLGGERPLIVGDRLDTDILGAHNAGLDSMLVLTGVTGLPELVAATPTERPTYLSSDLKGLLETHPAGTGPETDSATGAWLATTTNGRLSVKGDGGVDDWWRCVADAAWAHRDTTGQIVSTEGVVPPAPVVVNDG